MSSNNSSGNFGRVNSCLMVVLLLIIAELLSPARLQATPTCAPGLPVQNFYINISGDVTNSGRTAEGPACVQVHFNALRFDIALTFETKISQGVDLSQALTGPAPSPKQGGQLSAQPTDERVATLNKIHDWLRDLNNDASTMANGVSSISVILDFIDANLGPGKTIPTEALKAKYATLLRPAFIRLKVRQFDALPTDLAPGTTCPSTPGSAAKDSVLAILQGYQSDNTFPPGHDQDIRDALSIAEKFKCGASDETSLATNIAILKLWDGRFQKIGLQAVPATAQVDKEQFVNATELNCGNIFNQSSSTTASVTVYDESQTLTGHLEAPSGHQDQNFFSLTCASPFAVSAGIEFSTITAREFAIIKTAGGANNTSINKFGLTSDSSFHPLPVALAHVRLWESSDHRFALHGSAGASGNIQGQNSGGSSAEFLMGASLSFFRTMFLTAGLHIGTESTLAGGFKAGDTVPSDISDVQVTKSYKKGFGLAITFTKP